MTTQALSIFSPCYSAMQRTLETNLFASSAIALAMVAAMPAQAEEAIAPVNASPATNVADDGNLGDIVVTATRRSERLQDVPASITALSSDQLAKTGTTTFDQVAVKTPGFFLSKTGDIRPRLYIRGVGSREYDPGFESSVGVFVDDMYIGRSSGVLSSLQDIERIEVLKGPQSTLYGRNTIAGAINVVTKSPTEQLSGEVRAGYSNFDSYELFGAVSGPLGSDKVLGRIMAYKTVNDGYVTNLTTGNRSQGYDNYGGRVRLLLKPVDTLRIDLIGDFSRGRGPSIDGKNQGSPADPGGAFFAGSTLGIAGSPRPVFVADRFADFYNRDSQLRRRADSLIGKVELDVPGGTFTTITAYRFNRFFENRDFDATSLDAVVQTTKERSRQFTQEVRFTSDANGPLSLGSRLKWIVGLFYYHDESNRNDRFDFGADSISAIFTGSPQNDVFIGDFRSNSLAGFGEATLKITDRLSLTTGIRYTKDRKRVIQSDQASALGVSFIDENFVSPIIRRDDDAWTPKVSLSYQISRDVLAYASYNRGYKGGGFQFIPTNLAAARTTFRPEKSDAYQIGLKTEFWNRRATFNIAGFYYDYRDLQVQRYTTLANGSIAVVTNNADKSTIKGIDIDSSVSPVDGMTLRVAYSYLDAKYDRYFNNQPGQPLTQATDFSGTRMVRSPKHTINVSADYAIGVGDNQTFTPRIDWTYRSEFFFEPGQGDALYGAAIPQTRQGGFSLVDLSANYVIGDFTLRAFVNNVFNKYYLSEVQKLPFNYIINFPGQPRTYGVSASFKF